jgi:predicted dehydrogenase
MSRDRKPEARPQRRLRLGMVGGGQGAFIGAVHRMAARLDDRYELVAGALSADPQRARDSALALGLAPDRAYGSFAEMARREKNRPDGIEVAAIVTPNDAHAAPARAFLSAGIHVICDKPLTTSLKQALALAEVVQKSGLVFGLTHNYTGYPLVRQAREMMAGGALGRLRVLQVEYAQDWLSTPLERTGHKQAAWRTDPKRSGPAGRARRYRDPCLQSGALRKRSRMRGGRRRSLALCSRSQARRQCPDAAALHPGRPGHALGEPGRCRQ